MKSHKQRVEDMKKQLDDMYHQIAVKFSKGMRSFKTKEERAEALRLLRKDIPISAVKKLYEVSIENEDYETSEAVKDFLQEKGESTDT